MRKKKRKSRVNQAGNYTKPTLRKRLFNKILRGNKGGNPGQWSARKAQMLALKKSQKSLRRWTKQKWRTKSGKPSSKTGERYLPERLLKAMTASEYAYETRKKRKAKKAGKQRAKYSRKTRKKMRRYS